MIQTSDYRQTKREVIRDLTDIAPGAAIGAALGEVDSALVTVGQIHGLPVTQGLQAMALLEHRGTLPPEVRRAYTRLLRLRNQAFHVSASDDAPDSALADRYLDTAFDLADTILRLVPRPDPTPTS